MNRCLFNRQSLKNSVFQGMETVSIRIMGAGLVCSLLWSFAVSSGWTSQASVRSMACEKLNVDTSDQNHYGVRGKDRCEGFYVQQIKQKYLNVLSLTWGAHRIDGDHVKEIFITAPGAKGRAVFVRAKPIPERIYYRMDGLIPAGGTFAWPVDEILTQTGLGAAEIGVLGWVVPDDAGCWAADPDRVVLVPVKVTTTKPDANNGIVDSDALQLRIRVEADTRQVQWRYLGGASAEWNELLSGKNIRAWDTFTVRLPLPNTQTVCLELRAQRRNSKWTRKTLRLQLTGLQV